MKIQLTLEVSGPDAELAYPKVVEALRQYGETVVHNNEAVREGRETRSLIGLESDREHPNVLVCANGVTITEEII